MERAANDIADLEGDPGLSRPGMICGFIGAFLTVTIILAPLGIVFAAIGLVLSAVGLVQAKVGHASTDRAVTGLVTSLIAILVFAGLVALG